VSPSRVPAQVLARLLVPNGARTLLTAAALFAVVLGLAGFATRLPLVLAVPVWIVAGFFVNGLVQLGHEAWHKSLFRSALANDVFGHVFGLLFFVPFRAARHAHLAHHRHNRTERDPDAYNVGAAGARVKIQFYVVVAFGLLLAPLHFGLLYPAVFMRGRALALHVLEVVVSALVVGATFGLWLIPHGHFGTFAKLWLVPLVFASPWNGLKSIADHYANEWRGDRFHTATTVRTNAFWTLVWSGLGHHLDHHLYPRVPGPALPELHSHLRADLLARGAPVFDGYFATFWRALVAGPTYVDDGHAFLTRRTPS
jgi:fatty acid desaturase